MLQQSVSGGLSPSPFHLEESKIKSGSRGKKTNSERNASPSPSHHQYHHCSFPFLRLSEELAFFSLSLHTVHPPGVEYQLQTNKHKKPLPTALPYELF